ncbi:FMN-dependent NADH-azoreductase [Halomonas sp. V046]|uniref:FMN-dependent NADH-azoreductase n=1 Tax=Halomonas sp. V046 TaxID=3459611 RepID=UPI0040446DA9
MTRVLHLDASARPGRSDRRPHGSHTRRLSAQFVEEWRRQRPTDHIDYRDIGRQSPSPISGDWIHAAFTKEPDREPWMREALKESDRLVDELLAADVIIAAVPMYNFGVPAGFKAYIDNIVRVGRTFGFDRNRQGPPYWPMLSDANKHLIILSARGDAGYDPGGVLAHANHVEPHLRTVFGYLGIDKVDCIAVEYDEFGDDRLAESLDQAERRIRQAVETLAATTAPPVSA